MHAVDNAAITCWHMVADVMTVWLIKVAEQASLPHARMGVQLVHAGNMRKRSHSNACSLYMQADSRQVYS